MSSMMMEDESPPDDGWVHSSGRSPEVEQRQQRSKNLDRAEGILIVLPGSPKLLGGISEPADQRSMY